MKNYFKQLLLTTSLLLCLGVQAWAQVANVQVIHNSADPAADTVDIYVNGALAIDDFAFRTATPFLGLPAGVALEIGVAPGNSTDSSSIIATFPIAGLTADENYVVMATGVLDPASFDTTANSGAIGFTLEILTPAQTSGTGSNVDFVAYHGSTDAPSVDVRTGGAVLIGDLSYGSFSSYLSVPATSYTLDVTPAGSSDVVASFEANLTGLDGGSAVVFASGFLNPANNQDGAAFGLFAALADGTVVEFPVAVDPGTANVQVIHNSADPAAETVDVYINGALAVDDFAFRTATSFLPLPAGTALDIGVAPGTSTGAGDIIATFPIAGLTADENYVVVATGVLDPASFDTTANPGATGFTLQILTSAQTSGTGTNVDFVAYHGSTDAPSVDVRTGGAVLIGDLSYGNFSSYLSVPATSYTLDVTPAGDSNAVASFEANLTGLDGGSAVVFASGFLNPANNQNGAAFGLFAALADGTVVEFPAVVDLGTANVQVIHNSADPAAETVDVYINGELAVDDFAFRTATPFIELPAGTALDIGVAPGTSTGAGDIIATFPIAGLTADENYVVVATGVLDPASFDTTANPGATGFTLQILTPAQTSGTGTNVDFVAYHGSTDAPSVDVRTGGAVLIGDLSYGNFSSYLSVPATSYTLDVTPAGDSNAVASFEANLTGLDGGSAVVFASGFLNPANNQNGAAFGLFAALADGTVVEFPAVVDLGTANVQVIHNSADPAAETVDVYINGELAVDDFAFRTATPFIELPAGTALEIGVAPGTSTGAGDIIATFPIAGLTADENYVVVATGVLDPASFDTTANPGATGFTLAILTPAQTSGANGNVDFVAYHGSTDAPSVDVLANNGGLISDLSYGNFTSYLSVPAAEYILSVTPTGANSTVVASFVANLNGLGGGSAVVFASGFLNPANNQNGAAFGLFAALADGTVVEFPVVDCSGIVSFSLVDADADTVITAYDPIMEGEVIELEGLPANLSIRANLCEGFSAGSVTFDLDGSSHHNQLENVMPYSLFGDISGDYRPWRPTPQGGDSFTLSAVAYTERNRGGTASAPFTLNFSFTRTTPPVANIQVIHNSPDPAAEVVDIYLDGVLVVDDFAFRTATPFIQLPADTPIEIGVAPGTSTGAGDILATFPVSGLVANENYVVVATGVLDPTAFDTTANPGSTGFTLAILTPARTSGTDSNVDFVAYHGSTDAPVVDVLANGGSLVEDLAYGNFSSYFSVPAASYTLAVTPGNDNSVIVAEYAADLSGLGGGSAVVFASGFLNPANNQNGAAFGLFAALADGTVVAFPLVEEDCSLAIESFSLIDPNTDEVIEGYEVIEDGASINLSSLSTRRPNIRANVCATSEISSVKFELTGSMSANNIENVVPYALFGDTEGNYQAWWGSPSNGDSYTLTATGYDHPNANGDAGSATTINFSFTSTGNRINRPVDFSGRLAMTEMIAYPNPANNFLRVRLNNQAANEVAIIKIFTLEGKQILEQEVEENIETELNISSLERGIYILQAIGNGYQEQSKVVINK